MSAARIQERSVYRRNSFITIETLNGPSSYTTGGDNFRSQVLSRLDRVIAVPLTNSGIRVVVVTGSVTGNQFRIQAFVVSGGATLGRLTGEVPSGTDLSADAFTVILEGN